MSKSADIMRGTNSIQPVPQLKLCGQPLESVCIYKYLDLLLSRNLSWSQHIKIRCSKARKLLGLIYRRFYQYSTSESLFQMFIALDRPTLEYASQVWSPYNVGEVNSIEQIQKFALIHMCSKTWDSSYQELLQLFSLPDLQQRRLYLDFSTTFRVVHGLFHFPNDVFVHQRALRTTQSSNYCSYICPFARTCSYFNSFVPRTIGY
jgi:hypothetical protein